MEPVGAGRDRISRRGQAEFEHKGHVEKIVSAPEKYQSCRFLESTVSP